MRLREKIFISYTLLIFISLSFLGYYSYDQNYKIAKEQILSSISGDIQQSDNSLQNLFFGIERQANLFASNHTVQEILSNSNAGDIKLEYDDFVNMDKTINIFEKNNDIYAIIAYAE
jgi:hypothetical protein